MHTLPDLPYPHKSLEPYIDRETMVIHHTKHHQSYVDNLNKALEKSPELQKMEVDELLLNIDKVSPGERQAVINNGGGHSNHSFFWKVMSPEKSEPSGEFKKVLEAEFGNVGKFMEKFTEKAMKVFGSGWAFLVLTQDKKLELTRHSFQNSPLMQGNEPLLGVDVWEHAYYLKYQNRRAEYIEAWWNLVNWKWIGDNFSSLLKKN